ncbi:MAG: hypothetical protein KDI16_04875 [Halioglobus sp.]|nr:hypothetical protein [Halioglobus sp.]
MNWITDEDTDRDTLLGRLPGVGAPYRALFDTLWQQTHIPPAVLELCRLRMAQLHRSSTDQQQAAWPVDQRQRQALRQWPDARVFTEAERACLAFTEIYAIDALSITDEQAQAVVRHYGDAGLVALIQALGVFDGMQRLGLIWHTSLPEASHG